MIPDYHIHTALCKHAIGKMEEYVRRAVELGLHEIAICDHIPLPDDFDLAHRMHISEFERYVKEIRRLRKVYPQINILFGIEADFYDGFEDYLDTFIKQYPFDLVIMSVHFIKNWPKGNWAFSYHFPKKSLTEIYSDYLSAVLRGVSSGLFDIIGHLDLVKSAEQSLLHKNTSQVKQILYEAKRQNMAIEINTSGLRKDIAETYPALTFLPLIAEAQLPVTFGSDAHEPSQVGFAFPEIENKIKAFSIIKPVRFQAREMTLYSLTDSENQND